MKERAYTVSEIGRMRIAVNRLLNKHQSYGFYVYSLEVEDVLRTYIVAGLSPADLESAATLAEADLRARSMAEYYTQINGVPP